MCFLNYLDPILPIQAKNMCFLARNYRNAEKTNRNRKNNPKNKIFFAQLYAFTRIKIAFIEKLKAKFKKRAPSDCLVFILVLENRFCLRKKVNP